LFVDCEFESPSWRGVFDTILCDKVWQWEKTFLSCLFTVLYQILWLAFIKPHILEVKYVFQRWQFSSGHKFGWFFMCSVSQSLALCVVFVEYCWSFCPFFFWQMHCLYLLRFTACGCPFDNFKLSFLLNFWVKRK
jgi:hypothetical protein